VLPELERFVEKQRGLRFTTPVRADLLDDAAFTDRLRQVNSRDADPARTAASQVSLTALGLLPPGTDLQAQTDRLLGAAVAGYYDPKTKALVVRGSRATPGVRATLAHELTHALQDQHFNLDRPDLDRALDESSLAFSGLVEGDAELVRSAYELTFSPSELSAADRETSSGAIPDVPPVLLQMVAFPYSAGPKFVGDLMQAGGRARVDAPSPRRLHRRSNSSTQRATWPARRRSRSRSRLATDPKRTREYSASWGCDSRWVRPSISARSPSRPTAGAVTAMSPGATAPAAACGTRGHGLGPRHRRAPAGTARLVPKCEGRHEGRQGVDRR
jgi:hypothetical protein